MKLRAVTDSFRYSPLVAARSAADDSSSRQQGQKREQSPKGKDPSDEYSEAEVQAAVSSFQDDAQTQANGLAAVVEGSGPGLRIHLHDATGAVLRQFTGAEFVELRESVLREGSGRGKILDQKL